MNNLIKELVLATVITVVATGTAIEIDSILKIRPATAFTIEVTAICSNKVVLDKVVKKETPCNSFAGWKNSKGQTVLTFGSNKMDKGSSASYIVKDKSLKIDEETGSYRFDIASRYEQKPSSWVFLGSDNVKGACAITDYESKIKARCEGEKSKWLGLKKEKFVSEMEQKLG